MQACPALADSAVASAVDCVACVVVAVVASVDVAATHVEDTIPLAAASRTKISTRTILAQITSGKLDFYFLVLFGAFWCFFVKK